MCNCSNKDSCLLNSKCLQENVVYKATITTQNKIKEYIGSTGGLFKKNWYTHNSDIRNKKYNVTELSKKIWNSKNSKIRYELKWNIMHNIGELNNVGKICNLEKLRKHLLTKIKSK